MSRFIRRGLRSRPSVEATFLLGENVFSEITAHVHPVGLHEPERELNWPAGEELWPGTKDIPTVPVAAWQHALVEAIRRALSASVSERLYVRVSSLEEKVNEIATAIEARPVVKSTAIYDLAEPRYRLKMPIAIVIEEYEEEVIATWPETDLYGEAEVESIAIMTLKRRIVELYEDLKRANQAELGELPSAWMRVLEATIAEVA